MWTDRTPLAGDDDGVANGQIVQPGWLHECSLQGVLNDAGATVPLLRGSDGAATFDFVRGGLPTPPSSGGDFTSSTQLCLANNRFETWVTDPTRAAPADGSWYFVRGAGCCGSWSYDSTDPAQIGSSSSEISAPHLPAREGRSASARAMGGPQVPLRPRDTLRPAGRQVASFRGAALGARAIESSRATARG